MQCSAAEGGGGKRRWRTWRRAGDPHSNLLSFIFKFVLSSLNHVYLNGNGTLPTAPPPPRTQWWIATSSTSQRPRLRLTNDVVAERKLSATKHTWSDPAPPLPLSQISIDVRRADPPNRFAAVSITVWPSVNPQEKMASLIGFACYRLAPDYCAPCCRWNGKVILIWTGTLIGIFTRLNASVDN